MGKLKFGSKSSNFMQGYPTHKTSALQSHVSGHSQYSSQSASEYDKEQAEIMKGKPKDPKTYEIDESKTELVDPNKKIKIADTGETKSQSSRPGGPGPVTEEPGPDDYKEKEGEEKKEKNKIDWKNVFKNIGSIMNRAGERYNERDPGEANWLPNRAVDNELEATPDSQNKQTEHKAPEANTTKATEDPMTAKTSTAGKVFKSEKGDPYSYRRTADGNYEYSKGGGNWKSHPKGSAGDKAIRERYGDEECVAGAGCAGTE